LRAIVGINCKRHKSVWEKNPNIVHHPSEWWQAARREGKVWSFAEAIAAMFFPTKVSIARSRVNCGRLRPAGRRPLGPKLIGSKPREPSLFCRADPLMNSSDASAL
jgi:hypothetical protein